MKTSKELRKIDRQNATDLAILGVAVVGLIGLASVFFGLVPALTVIGAVALLKALGA